MELKGESISLSQLTAVAVGGEAVQISPVTQPRILASRKVVEEIINRDAVVYGVTTGFGKLSDVRIPRDALNKLQLNLVRSHACGIGQPLSEPEVRAMDFQCARLCQAGTRWRRSNGCSALSPAASHSPVTIKRWITRTGKGKGILLN